MKNLMVGMKTSLKIKKYEDLPVNCRKYIERVQEILDCPISVVSVGPDRNQNIYIKENIEKKFHIK